MMSVEHSIRLLAGSLVLAGLALGHWLSPHWRWLAVFVDLIQSSFTRVCPAEGILRKLGFGKPGARCCS